MNAKDGGRKVTERVYQPVCILTKAGDQLGLRWKTPERTHEVTIDGPSVY